MGREMSGKVTYDVRPTAMTVLGSVVVFGQ